MNSLEHKTGLWFQSPLQLPTSLSSWVLAAALFMSPLSGVRLGESMSYGDLLFAVACAIGFGERILNREKIYFFAIYLVAAILITLSFAANKFFPVHMSVFDFIEFVNSCVSNHVDIEFSQTPNFRVIFASLIIFPLAFLLLRPRNLNELRTLIYFWTAGGMYGAGFTVLFCMGWISGHTDAYWAVIHRPRGLTMHPNAMALSSVLTFPGLMLLFLEAKNLIPRVLAILLALVTWRAINYSGSRTALYTMTVMFVFMFVLMYRDVPPRIRLRLIGLGAAVISAYLFMKYATGPVTEYSAAWRLQNGSVVSDTIRAHDQDLAIAGFVQSPIFGEGYQWLRIAHNMYLQVLHSAGLVGLTGYLLAYLFPLYMLLTVRPLAQNFVNRVLKNALLTAAFGVIVWGWAQTNINALNPTVPMGLLLYISVMRLDLVGRYSPQVHSVSSTPRQINGSAIHANS